MSHIARFLLRGYLRVVGAYIDRRNIEFPNITAGDDER